MLLESIFLHKYDPKHNQIYARVLKLDKNIYLSFIYSGKLSNITYLWVAKVCESLGLAVNLKVKLESMCAELLSVRAMTIKCQYVTSFIQRTGIYQSLIMFVEVNHVTNKGDYWDLGKSVYVAHQARKGYKTISKEFGLHKSTVRQTVYKWRIFKTTVTFPRSGRPTTITPKQNV